MKNWSDKEMISCLQGDKVNRELALEQLYAKLYPVIKSYINNNSGSDEDAADIFQDAIIVFYEKVRLDKFQLSSSIKTYLYSVCKHLWLNKLRAQKKVINLTEEDDVMTIDPLSLNVIGSRERNDFLNKLLDSLGPDCKRILVYYYYDRFKMKEIADRMSFANDQVAKNKKSSCLKKLKTIVSQSPRMKNILK